MASAVAWLDALRRLERRVFQRARIPILRRGSPMPARSGSRPDVRVIEQARRVEFAFVIAGARPESTQVYWSEEAHTLTVYAPIDCAESPASVATPGSSGSASWYAEIPVASDVDASRAQAFLEHGTLRIVAPRIDSHPLTGLPLLVWTDAPSSWSLAPTT